VDGFLPDDHLPAGRDMVDETTQHTDAGSQRCLSNDGRDARTRSDTVVRGWTRKVDDRCASEAGGCLPGMDEERLRDSALVAVDENTTRQPAGRRRAGAMAKTTRKAATGHGAVEARQRRGIASGGNAARESGRARRDHHRFAALEEACAQACRAC